MRILLTNDDGINAPGLWSAAEALNELGELTVVAPDRDLSGIGAAMTLTTILRAAEVASPVEGVKAYSVQGTPGDCVILATEALVKEPFDLVVSGINQGANFGLDVINSGTVGGAFHGYFRDIPSIAVSVASLTSPRYDAAAWITHALGQAVLASPMPAPLLLNVNLPSVGLDEIEMVQLTRLGPKAFLENVERGGDGRREFFWIRPQPIDKQSAGRRHGPVGGAQQAHLDYAGGPGVLQWNPGHGVRIDRAGTYRATQVEIIV